MVKWDGEGLVVYEKGVEGGRFELGLFDGERKEWKMG